MSGLPGCTCPHDEHDLLSGPCQTPGCWCVLDLVDRKQARVLAAFRVLTGEAR